MTTESQINAILDNPFDSTWSIQGFGMLRTYLDDEHKRRLHIWDATRAVDEVSTIHDHPWDFTSRIVRGEIYNQRYLMDVDAGVDYQTAQIRCGVGGGLLTEPRPTQIIGGLAEHYLAGEWYGQMAEEIHESHPSRGTVTVITRGFKADRERATVAWRTGSWVSAEPRPATREEIEHFVGLARGLA